MPSPLMTQTSGGGVAYSIGFLFTVSKAVMARVQRGAQNP
jgi:hypothetical protein